MGSLTVYYNENAAYPAQWLRQLMAGGVLPDGVVDDRSIVDLKPEDVSGFQQAHFFAGIGGWSHALRLAGWPTAVPVWTGSCPCQPFSGAGRRRGFSDERHLWPQWFGLIRKCRPSVIFSEQVASPDGLTWLDAVSADLEDAGYAFGAADLCAAGVGAPHLRQRLYWVAYTNSERCTRFDAHLRGWQSRNDLFETSRRSSNSGMGDANANRAREHARELHGDEAEHADGSQELRDALEHAGAVGGFWADAEWRERIDGKAAPLEPGTLPMVDGFPSRVGRVRAYGNAIVPQVAAVFVEAVMAELQLEA